MRQKPLNIRTTVALRLAHTDADTVHPLTTSEGDLRGNSTHRGSICREGYCFFSCIHKNQIFYVASQGLGWWNCRTGTAGLRACQYGQVYFASAELGCKWTAHLLTLGSK